MFESIVLGIVQGIAEWLPISSEGMIVLVKNNFFGGGPLVDTIKTALFLHLGTFLAALIYFRRDVKNIYLWINDFASSRSGASPTLGELCRLSTGELERDRESGKILRFIIIATLISALLGWGLLEIITNLENLIAPTTRFINVAIAVLLAITGVVQLRRSPKSEVGAPTGTPTPTSESEQAESVGEASGLKKRKNGGHRNASELKDGDSILLGVAQGAAVLPGLSRSGLTVSALLLRNFQDNEALRLSFLLSLPIVLAGNILLNFNQAIFSLNNLVALLFSFIFGYLTISLFLKLAEKINFGWFAIVFAGLVFLSVFL